jgi:uncharacterized membrane protein YjjB (DUF3815 family)
MGFYQLFQDTVCGGLAAAGFGVLFNVGYRGLPWCAASGALALALRTVALGEGWSLEAASFVAALAVGVAVQLLPSPIGISRNALHVVGCIQMIPGAFAAKAILGLFAITAQHSTATNETLIAAMDNTLRVALTMGALGTGVAIPTLLLRVRELKWAGAD